MIPPNDGEILERMRTAATEYDWASLTHLADEYTRLLHGSPTVSLPEAADVIELLRRNRKYDALMSVADAALANQPGALGIWRQYAQALVDTHRTAPALRIYTEVFGHADGSEVDRIEAGGGIARCYKQLFLATTQPGRRAEFLRLALDRYLGAYTEDPGRIWHGINAAALLRCADREDIRVPDIDDPRAMAREIAERVRTIADAQPQSDPWSKATGCEACVAAGDIEPAIRRGAAFVEDPDTGAFAIASFLRQLQEVWGLDATTPLGNALLPVLRSALLEKEGGRVVVETADVAPSRLPTLDRAGLEKVLGAERYNSLTWYRNGLLRCQAVARIETLNGDGLGTGFLVTGSELHPELPATVLVTNGHVIPEGLHAGDARVVFHGIDAASGPNSFSIVNQWWYAPSNSPQLDTTVLELDGCPRGVNPIPVAKRVPNITETSRAYVIGHPRGLEQPQFSLQDNLLLACDGTRLHYRSPTEPGSSGSPVFDNQWSLIGLHHAGDTAMPRLNGEQGTYPANEALRIDAIRDELQRRPPKSEAVT